MRFAAVKDTTGHSFRSVFRSGRDEQRFNRERSGDSVGGLRRGDRWTGWYLDCSKGSWLRFEDGGEGRSKAVGGWLVNINPGVDVESGFYKCIRS